MEKRVAMDCRKTPSVANCSVYLSGREEEIVPIAIEHAIKVHEAKRGPELEKEIRDSLEPELSTGVAASAASTTEARPVH
jgi:hypothetical protein